MKGSKGTPKTDYTALPGSVTIPAGSFSAVIDVSGIIDDAIVEADETVVVTLTAITCSYPWITVDTSPDNRTATVTILDNDSATVSITANDATASETATDN